MGSRNSQAAVEAALQRGEKRDLHDFASSMRRAFCRPS
jgi:hypothetical protein